MKFTIELDKNQSADAIGETLREYSFVKRRKYDFGCYSTFELKPEFKAVEENSDLFKRFLHIINPMNDDWMDDLKFHAFSNGEIHVGWIWDGDGTLVFVGPDFAVMNTDCKKDHGWDHIENEDQKA